VCWIRKRIITIAIVIGIVGSLGGGRGFILSLDYNYALPEMRLRTFKIPRFIGFYSLLILIITLGKKGKDTS